MIALSERQKLAVNRNAHHHDLVGSSVRLHDEPGRYLVVVDVHKASKSKTFTLMTPNGHIKVAKPAMILELETPDGRLYRGA